MKYFNFFCLSCAALFFSAAPSFASGPKPDKIGLQPAGSPNMQRLHSFHDDLLLWIIGAVCVFVLALLIIVALRFNAKANPEASKTTHNVPLEIIWTVVPVVILIIIAVPSFKLLYYLDRSPETEMTLKVSGYQWGWTYSYPDQKIEEYNADFISDDELDEYIPDGKGRRLLETYNPVVLPTGKNIQVIATATDVIHSWAVPSLGIKKDSVPGRLNETWVRISKPGKYYGQCSEICGKNHAFMPISIYGVPADEFDKWVECVKGDEANADYPARACVKKLGFDKYTDMKSENELAQVQ